jgi:hypothetical protein
MINIKYFNDKHLILAENDQFTLVRERVTGFARHNIILKKANTN